MRFAHKVGRSNGRVKRQRFQKTTEAKFIKSYGDLNEFARLKQDRGILTITISQLPLTIRLFYRTGLRNQRV